MENKEYKISLNLVVVLIILCLMILTIILTLTIEQRATKEDMTRLKIENSKIKAENEALWDNHYGTQK